MTGVGFGFLMFGAMLVLLAIRVPIGIAMLVIARGERIAAGSVVTTGTQFRRFTRKKGQDFRQIRNRIVPVVNPANALTAGTDAFYLVKAQQRRQRKNQARWQRPA